MDIAHSLQNRKETRLPVDRSKLNLGNSYDPGPEYYYDQTFTCKGCGKAELWTAAQQKWWYEDVGGYFFATAIRCRSCRAKERERRENARRMAGHQI
ncbi:zinc-ribbon domain containing protein [Marinobacterium jannaschii]|uniref:zinc-ribbon domain containing protein n=1 Tax=Marinobacterium jannaschii TaxID=64970 RepID=UPI000B171113|nr:zinc-ribbon domain containing protein [Marinobacterium jannaschii]